MVSEPETIDPNLIPPNLNLSSPGDPERPIFVQVNPHETTQLQDHLADRQNLVQVKDLG